MDTTDDANMLDTTEFNKVHRGEVPIASFAGRRVLVTGIQKHELLATRNPKIRESLVTIFEGISPTGIPAASFAAGIEGAGLGQAYCNDGSGTFEKMLNRLKELDPPNKKPENQLRDILIAETAIKNGAVLVSGDKNLRQVTIEFGGRATDRLP